MDKSKVLFKKYISVIFKLFDKPEYTFANTEKLQAIFYKSLFEILELSFDLNINIEKLEKINSTLPADENHTKFVEFISNTLDNKEAYDLINQYCYKFLQSYLDVAKPDKRQAIEKLMIDEGLNEKEVLEAIKDYRGLAFKKSSTV